MVELAGRSPLMTDTLAQMRRIAESRCNPVLIVGETGTGKEQAARAVHYWRNGESNDFIAVNCAALTATLLESELFGHTRGSFTGADREKAGLFEAAGTGTIFLDEISEMPMDLQAKLLRVIQESSFRKVGGTQDIQCHATIIASSNRDLLAAADDGQFRRDLYYRLAVFPVRMPPLRAAGRRSDIAILARYFLETSGIRPDHDVCGFTSEAEQILLSHDWPGNVRELRNVIDRALIMEGSDRVQVSSIHIDRADVATDPTFGEDGQRLDLSLETAEQIFIRRALKETGWQRTRAAGLLGITRATLHTKLKKYGINPPEANAEAPEADDATAPAEVACA
jgi:two-component system response regulator HydG